MEYQVPQFIEVEDKLVGPLTLKQFLYLAGTAGLCVIFFSYLPFLLALLLSVPIGGFGVALAFYRINNKPLIDILEAGFSYYTKKRLLLWRHDASSGSPPPSAESAPLQRRADPRLTRGKLSELAWSLDVHKERKQ